MDRSFDDCRLNFSGKAIVHHTRDYFSNYGMSGVVYMFDDYLRIAKKQARKIKRRLNELYYETRLFPAAIHSYSQWLNDLQNDEFVNFTDDPLQKEGEVVKIYAFYLTQFHPIPENDNAFGKGFTEWTNVAKAMPQFAGHFQPKIPYELGFYNLLMPGVMEKQVEIARAYGIYGFCFYFYWFSGKKLLEKPLEYFLQSSIDFHFHLFWANESWSKRWDGGDRQIIVNQEINIHEADSFFDDILPYIKDPRYEKIGNRPLLTIYRTERYGTEVMKGFVEVLNRRAIAEGFDGMYISMVKNDRDEAPSKYGADSITEFPPNSIDFFSYQKKKRLVNNHARFIIVNGRNFVDSVINASKPTDYPVFKTCFPSWDNTPRKLFSDGLCIQLDDSDYHRWLASNIRHTIDNLPDDCRITYINAWNEWGEGAILEPTTRYGYKNLQTVLDVLRETACYKTSPE